MSWELVLVVSIGLIFILLLLGQWIALALGLAGVILLYVSGGSQALLSIGSVVWNNVNSYILIAIPLFILMGDLILRSGVSGHFYRGIATLLGFLPGGLLHSNIMACAMFAAVSGSSVATAATVGTVAIPEMTRQGYAPKIILGSLAAGGTLGILIPPSIIMILYGALVEESVPKLFMAGVIPGLVLALLFMLYISMALIFNRALAPPRTAVKVSPKDYLHAIAHIMPIIALMLMVLGGIYAGVTTPTEAAAVGVFGALILAAAYRGLNFDTIKKSLLSATRTTTMVLFIIVGAQILSAGLTLSGAARGMGETIIGMELSKWQFFAVLVVMYIILGCFVDGITMIYITLPVLFDVIVAAGFNVIWFGVVLTILIELGQITPPVGLTLFTIHGISGGHPFSEVVKGVIPFVLIILAMVVILAVWPNLALWLPSMM